MRRRILFLIIFVIVITMACATVGRKFDVEVAKQNIKIGKSSTDDVLRICGEPLSKKTESNLEIWHYSYVEKNVTGLGVFTHCLGIGTEWKSQRQLMNVFFKNGIVTDIKTDSAEDTKMHYGR